VSVQSQVNRRKTYAAPALRSYGSVVATTRGSVGTKTDGAGAKKPG
jgi:hypothetical protein